MLSVPGESHLVCAQYSEARAPLHPPPSNCALPASEFEAGFQPICSGGWSGVGSDGHKPACGFYRTPSPLAHFDTLEYTRSHCLFLYTRSTFALTRPGCAGTWSVGLLFQGDRCFGRLDRNEVNQGILPLVNCRVLELFMSTGFH